MPIDKIKALRKLISDNEFNYLERGESDIKYIYEKTKK